MSEPKTDEEIRNWAEDAKRSLIENMVLYGISEEQAKIQVQSLIDATRAVAEIELY